MDDQPETTSEETPHGDDARKLKAFFEQFNNATFVGKSGLWTAIFTGILAFFTYQQIRLVQIANQNAIATQRAFITLTGGLPGTKGTEGGKITRMGFQVMWTNNGTTPAKSLIGRASIQAWTTELPRYFDFADLPIEGAGMPSVISAKATFLHSVSVPIDDVIDIITKKHHLYLWGWVAYNDVFQGTPRRLTEFCVEPINVSASSTDYTDPKTEYSWISQPCPVPHNCADEDCEDYKQRAK